MSDARGVVRVAQGRRPVAVALGVLVAASSAACSLVNPAYDAESQGGSGSASEGTTLGSESGSATQGSDAATGASVSGGGSTGTAGTSGSSESTGTAGTSGTSEGTGSSGAGGSSGESTGTTGVEPLCGDGVVDDGELCDDGNDAPDDGCVACVIPASCAEILELAPGSPSGPYKIDPKGLGTPWPMNCDMVMDGGGWTGIKLQDTCNGRLDSQLKIFKKAGATDGIDDQCRRWVQYPESEGGNQYNYAWDITFPPGFTEFFLRGYKVKAIGDVELNFGQTLWTVASEFPKGALSLGDAKADGPVANWFKDGGMGSSFVDGEIRLYPVQDKPFALGQSTDTLRIGYGEHGYNHEGIFPWWAGQIFVR